MTMGICGNVMRVLNIENILNCSPCSGESKYRNRLLIHLVVVEKNAKNSRKCGAFGQPGMPQAPINILTRYLIFGDIGDISIFLTSVTNYCWKSHIIV